MKHNPPLLSPARELAEQRGSIFQRNNGGLWGGSGWPWIVCIATVVVTVILLRAEGRRWWCACGEWSLWKSDVWSSHCSQHLFDPYSLSHVSHGLIFCGLIMLTKRWALRLQLEVAWQLCIVIGAAAFWEVVENSTFVIDRYRNATMSLNYLGDSIANSLGDIASCMAGFFIARWFGWVRSIVLFVALELVLLWWIRDNLTLNVIMLLWPIDAIKMWQSVGHVAG